MKREESPELVPARDKQAEETLRAAHLRQPEDCHLFA